MTDLYTTLALLGGIALLSIAGLWIFLRRTRSRNVFPEETWDSFQPEKEADTSAPGPPEGMERIGGDASGEGFQPPEEAEAGGDDEDKREALPPERPGGDVEALAGGPPERSFSTNGGAVGGSAEDAPPGAASRGKGPWWETLPANPDAPPRRTVAQLMGIGLGDAPPRPEAPPEAVSEAPSTEAEAEEEISLSPPDLPAPGTLEPSPPFAEEDEAEDMAAGPIDGPEASFDEAEDAAEPLEATEEEPEFAPLAPGDDMSEPAASAESSPEDEPILLPEDEGPNFFDVLQSLPDTESAAAGAPPASEPGEETTPAVFPGETAEDAAAEISPEPEGAPMDLSIEGAAAPEQELAPEHGGEGERPFAMESLAGEDGEAEQAFATPAEVEAGMAADVEAKIEQESGPAPPAEPPAMEEELPLVSEEATAAPVVSEPAQPPSEKEAVPSAAAEEMVLEPEEAVSAEAPLVFTPEEPAGEIVLGDESLEEEKISLDAADASAEEEIELLEDAAVPSAETELTLESEAETPAAAESSEEEEMVLLSEGEEEPLDVFSVMGEPEEEEPPAPVAPPPAETSPGMFAEEEEESSIWADDKEKTPAAPAEIPVSAEVSEAPPAPPEEAAAPAPSGSPLAQISALVSEICPGDLIYIDAREASLPDWAESAVERALADIDAHGGGRGKSLPEEYLRLGIAELFLGRAPAAIARLKEALRRSDRLGPVLNALAVAMYDQGKIDPAISYCRESIREAGSDKGLQNAVQRNLALLYLEKGDAARAAEFSEAAIEGITSGEPLGVKAQLHLRAGQLFRRLGDLEKARHHLYEANLQFQKTRDEILQVRSLVGLAAVQGDIGEFEHSLRNLEEAMRIAQDSGDKAGKALVLGQLGIAYTSRDQFTRALEHYEQALALHRELGSDKGTAANLSNIGNIHYFRGDLKEARSAYEAALEMNRKEGHSIGQATTLGNLGRVFFEQENYPKARACLGEARDLFREAGAEEQLANVRQILEEVEQAERS